MGLHSGLSAQLPAVSTEAHRHHQVDMMTATLTEPDSWSRAGQLARTESSAHCSLLLAGAGQQGRAELTTQPGPGPTGSAPSVTREENRITILPPGQARWQGVGGPAHHETGVHKQPQLTHLEGPSCSSGTPVSGRLGWLPAGSSCVPGLCCLLCLSCSCRAGCRTVAYSHVCGCCGVTVAGHCVWLPSDAVW